MKNKPNDIPYLGCDQEKIKNSNPKISEEFLKHYYEFITERYSIYKKRCNGENPPWTENKILQNYKFTNVRREHDRTSKWIIDHISNNKNLSYEDRFYRTMLARIYNRIETFEAIHIDEEDFWDKYIENARILESIKGDVYTRAYRTVSMKFRYKKDYPDFGYKAHNLLHVRDIAIKNEWKIPSCATENAIEAIKWIEKTPGIGDFIAYQIFCDFTYIDEYPISENEFTIAGPGCRRGMDFLFEDRDGMTYEETIFWMRDNFDEIMQRVNPEFKQAELFDNLPEYDRHVNVQSIENVECEYSKYIYLLQGRHKHPRRYNGRGD